VNGKPDSYGVQTLPADGKSVTDVSRSPGKLSEKSSAVFVKQRQLRPGKRNGAASAARHFFFIASF
jgi:hypothetical protein